MLSAAPANHEMGGFPFNKSHLVYGIKLEGIHSQHKPLAFFHLFSAVATIPAEVTRVSSSKHLEPLHFLPQTAAQEMKTWMSTLADISKSFPMFDKHLGFPEMGISQNGWFIMENPTEK